MDKRQAGLLMPPAEGSTVLERLAPVPLDAPAWPSPTWPPGHPASRYLRIACRPWPLARLREMADRDLVRPAGVTRFVAPGRVIGADIPLAMLSGDRPGPLVSRDIRQRAVR